MFFLAKLALPHCFMLYKVMVELDTLHFLSLVLMKENGKGILGTPTVIFAVVLSLQAFESNGNLNILFFSFL